jgi:hypothetical protein
MFQMVKKVMENRLVGNRRQIRALIVDRALLQHESRLLERSNTMFTTGHQQILEALLELVNYLSVSISITLSFFSLDYFKLTLYLI